MGYFKPYNSPYNAQPYYTNQTVWTPLKLPNLVLVLDVALSRSTGKLWQDVAQTIPAIANNDPVRVIIDPYTNTVLTAPTDAARMTLVDLAGGKWAMNYPAITAGYSWSPGIVLSTATYLERGTGTAVLTVGGATSSLTYYGNANIDRQSVNAIGVTSLQVTGDLTPYTTNGIRRAAGAAYEFRKNGALNGSGTNASITPGIVNKIGPLGFSTDRGTFAGLIITSDFMSSANLALAEAYLTNLTPAAPVNLTLPRILGIPENGQVLSIQAGTYHNAPATLTYQWKRDGSAISTASTYTFNTTNDAGHDLTVTETATNVGGSVSTTSLAFGGSVFIASGQFTVPDHDFVAEGIGAGGGGGSTTPIPTDPLHGGGGGGGGGYIGVTYAKGTFAAASKLDITIGTGGTSTSNGNPGNLGGDAVLKQGTTAILLAHGGLGGNGNNVLENAGSPGGIPNDLNVLSIFGSNSMLGFGHYGNKSVSAAGGAGGDGLVLGTGGASKSNATGVGGGGGGSSSSPADVGGTGGNAEVRFSWPPNPIQEITFDTPGSHTVTVGVGQSRMWLELRGGGAAGYAQSRNTISASCTGGVGGNYMSGIIGGALMTVGSKLIFNVGVGGIGVYGDKTNSNPSGGPNPGNPTTLTVNSVVVLSANGGGAPINVGSHHLYGSTDAKIEKPNSFKSPTPPNAYAATATGGQGAVNGGAGGIGPVGKGQPGGGGGAGTFTGDPATALAGDGGCGSIRVVWPPPYDRLGEF